MLPPATAPAFLASHGWGGATIEPLAGDASFRRYFRVRDRGRTAVLMDAPPDREDSRPFLFVAEALLARGFAAPRLIAGDLGQGLLLLEDFGDRRMGPELAAGRVDEEAIYEAAVDLLVALHRVPPPPELPIYDRGELLREVLLFLDWYAPAAGLAVDRESFVAAWDATWGQVLAETARAPVLTLRDYHADNIMLRDGHSGLQALGLLDFQDALAGHRAYDLVSLLQDARRDVSPRLEARMRARFIARAGIAGEAAFRAAYEVLGAQRNVKILGIFVRLRDRDGRRGYVEMLPRVWGYLARNLAHPALAPVSRWFEAQVPHHAREPWCQC
ncbi:aminoglycoside phosphotransferase family protein [Thermaurantiacus sp.]